MNEFLKRMALLRSRCEHCPDTLEDAFLIEYSDAQQICNLGTDMLARSISLLSLQPHSANMPTRPSDASRKSAVGIPASVTEISAKNYGRIMSSRISGRMDLVEPLQSQSRVPFWYCDGITQDTLVCGSASCWK